MKQIFTLMLVAFAINAHAQCVETDLGLDSAVVPGFIRGAEAVNDGIVAGVILTQLASENSLLLSKADLNGDMLWQRILTPSDPDARLQPIWTIGTSDGGLLAYGDVLHKVNGVNNYYFNQFATKLDASGCTEWSRLFMVHGSSLDWQHWENPLRVVELGSGDFRMDVIAQGLDTMSVRQVHIDPQGQPINVHSYARTFPFWTAHTCEASDGGTHILMSNGVGFTYNHFDPSGVFQSGFSFDGLDHSEMAYVQELSNGDLLFYQTPALVRIDPTGTLVWARTYDNLPGSITWLQESLVELDQGELLWLNKDMLLHLDGSGAPLESWHHDPDCPTSLSRTNGGLVLVKQLCDVMQGTASPAVRIVHATDVADLVCGMTPGTVPTSSPISSTVNPASAYYTALTTTLKSWDFAMTTGCDATLTMTDLTPSLSAAPARPGFTTPLFISITDLAMWPSDSIDVVLTVPAPLTPIWTDPPATSVVGNTVTWSNRAPLAGFGSTLFQATVTTPADPLLLGTPITYVVAVSQDSAEASTTNNVYSFTDTISGAYDPNDKLVRTSSGLNDAEFYPSIDEWLDYTIRFQNTGTDTAFTVVVTDTLPAELSTGTLNILSASHPYTYEFGGDGILRFTFNNILLPDSNVNEALSHGLVSFRIQPDDGLVLGTTITNNADIFFDFNPPIRTPDAVVMISMPTSLPELNTNEILIYPVPVREVLIAQLPEGFVMRRVDILSSDGRLVRSPNISPLSNRLDVGTQGLVPGVYLLSVEGAKGQRLTARFVKE
ncbi:MAG: DUF11 domain-containing protein [Flavobacteriales bacterium]|nr:DUF11 domain-containing protein [Flavobacteriales bacterium]MBK6752850.1 DUF11 domain-containing protein [Flavobacteriales bacterium]MBK7754534.1 DUF11 domain-containing protein [Flavobacteriales bacterium]MBK9075812.1 DUF11 domain-containing protein [Flavobacteriales bacterium]MBK9537419.1 DUF11 domain-containing protein [Flavobacteriales bacterium]